ncbi:MAG: hypothetical protein AAFX06_27730 [Planctomycetota bacterium]
MAALEHASLIKPLDPEAGIALAIGYGALGKTRLSKDLLMSHAVSGRADEMNLLAVAAGLEAIDEPTLAMEACRRAGVLAPESAEVHYQMGHYASSCDYPLSVIEALIRHAIHLEPSNVHYRIGLASLLVRLERRREALQAIGALIPSHLGDVTCKCCLKRIANLYFDCEEFEIARRVAQRLDELEGRSAGVVRRHP